MCWSMECYPRPISGVLEQTFLKLEDFLIFNKEMPFDQRALEKELWP